MQLHLTLIDSKDTARPEIVLSQTIFKPPAAPGPALEPLRAALVAAGARDDGAAVIAAAAPSAAPDGVTVAATA